MTIDRFLKVLFEPEEQTCYASSPYDTKLYAQPTSDCVFFSINPMHTSRKDENVTCYRNILLELDKVPIEQQMNLVLSKIPVSTIVFSGNKSYHFIISLKEPAKDRETYDRIVRGLMQAIPEADPTTKNPSRLSRFPGVFRPDTRLFQELVYVGERISVDKLPKPKQIAEKPVHIATNIVYVSGLLQQALDNPDQYIMSHFGGRNQFFYWVGRRCTELKHTREEKKKVVDRIYDKLQNKKGFSKNEAYSAARVKL